MCLTGTSNLQQAPIRRSGGTIPPLPPSSPIGPPPTRTKASARPLSRLPMARRRDGCGAHQQCRPARQIPGGPVLSRQRATPDVARPVLGAGAGAERHGQMREGALRRRQSCRDQAVYLPGCYLPAVVPGAALCSHRGVRGSVPLCATQVSGQFRVRDGPLLPSVQQRSAATLAIELLAQPPKGASGPGCGHLAVDRPRHRDLAAPQDLHGRLGMRVERDQQRGAGATGSGRGGRACGSTG